MTKNVKVLVVVEGLKSEVDLFQRIANVYGLNISFYCLGTNIYLLYKRLKEYGFSADLKKVLCEIHPEYQEILQYKFAYTYLVFDLDPHHPKKVETRSLTEVVEDNLSKIEEMVLFFNNETDPTIGKLYINYPMLESFRDCNSTFDPDYQTNVIKIEDVSNYKSIVAKKRMASKHLTDYSKGDFDALTKMNNYKLSEINSLGWKALSYSQYCELSEGSRIFAIQRESIVHKKVIEVINTSLFFILDYYGDKDGIYDSIID